MEKPGGMLSNIEVAVIETETDESDVGNTEAEVDGREIVVDDVVVSVIGVETTICDMESEVERVTEGTDVKETLVAGAGSCEDSINVVGEERDTALEGTETDTEGVEIIGVDIDDDGIVPPVAADTEFKEGETLVGTVEIVIDEEGIPKVLDKVPMRDNPVDWSEEVVLREGSVWLVIEPVDRVALGTVDDTPGVREVNVNAVVGKIEV